MNVERLIETLERVLSEQHGVKVTIELEPKEGENVSQNRKTIEGEVI